MISNDDGKLLTEALRNTDSLLAKFVPMICIPSQSETRGPTASKCEPTKETDRKFVESLDYSGIVELIKTSGNLTYSFEALQAQFGSRLKAEEVLNLSVTEHACKALKDVVSGNAVFVQRGECDFAVKAETIANAGGAMMILSNSDDNILRMEVDKRAHRHRNLHVPILMVSDETGSALLSHASQTSGALIKISRKNKLS